jgi:hypothetical protein
LVLTVSCSVRQTSNTATRVLNLEVEGFLSGFDFCNTGWGLDHNWVVFLDWFSFEWFKIVSIIEREKPTVLTSIKDHQLIKVRIQIDNWISDGTASRISGELSELVILAWVCYGVSLGLQVRSNYAGRSITRTLRWWSTASFLISQGSINCSLRTTAFPKWFSPWITQTLLVVIFKVDHVASVPTDKIACLASIPIRKPVDVDLASVALPWKGIMVMSTLQTICALSLQSKVVQKVQVVLWPSNGCISFNWFSLGALVSSKQGINCGSKISFNEVVGVRLCHLVSSNHNGMGTWSWSIREHILPEGGSPA